MHPGNGGYGEVAQGADDSGGRNRQHPGPNDLDRHAPADGAERRMVPKPTIEPAMVWVVLTGMPAAAVAKSVTAAPDSRRSRRRGPAW